MGLQNIGKMIAIHAVTNQIKTQNKKRIKQYNIELEREKEFIQFILQDFRYDFHTNDYEINQVETPFIQKENMRKLIEKYKRIVEPKQRTVDDFKQVAEIIK